jgi:M6 family metalloprotease-like protein
MHRRLITNGRLVGLLWLAGWAWAQQQNSADTLVDQIVNLNKQLLAAMESPQTNPTTLRALLSERALRLEQLVVADPSKLSQTVLPDALLAQVRAAAPDALVETTGEWEGTVEETIADDFEHGRSIAHWTLRTADRRLEMYFRDKKRPSPGTTIRLKGVRLGNQVAVGSFTRLAAASIQKCSTTGVQNTAVLLVTTPANPTFPASFTPSYFQQVFFGPSTGNLSMESLNSFWQQSSYGLASAAGQVFGPLALSQNYTCDQLSEMTIAAIAAADSLTDLTQFQRIAIAFPAQSCSFTGSSNVGCVQGWNSPSKGPLTASVSWLPIFPSDQPTLKLGVLAHELGHALGLGHGNSDDYSNVPLGPLNDPGSNTEYGDRFSVMGATGWSYNSQPIAGQYSAQHKALDLHWLPPGSFQEVQSSGTYTLVPFELSGGRRALRILRDPASGAWLWAEYRQQIGDIDSSLSLWLNFGTSNVFSGALIHYEDPDLDPLHTYLLDFNPSSAPNNFLNSALTPGRSWSDPYSSLTLMVNSATSNSLSITASYDTPCATVRVSPTVFAASSGTGTISISGSVSCLWSVSTLANWITFTDPTSGQGNGSVGFTVAANSAAGQRNAYITAQRQSIPIFQEGTRVSVLSVSPNSGSGNSGQLTFQFNDGAGYTDISDVEIIFSDADGSFNDCHLRGPAGSGYLWLMSDDGRQMLGPLYLGNRGQSLSNSQCTIYGTGSAVSGSGNLLSVTLQVSFSPTFTGTHRITAQANGPTTAASPVTLGIWTVPPDVAGAGLRDAAGSIRLSTYTSSTLLNSGGVFASDPSVAQDLSGNTFATARDSYNSIWANVYNATTTTWSGWRFGGGVIQGVPSIAVDTAGTGWIASRDNYNSYWLVNFTTAGGFGSWAPLMGVFSTDPVVTACGDGSIYLIGKDNYNALWSGHYIPGTGFQGWRLGGGVVKGKPAATCGGDNAVYIVAEDNSNSNWIARVIGNTWTGWFNGGAVTSVGPRIATLANGSEAVVILDPTGAVWRTTFADGTVNGWQPWVQVGGVLQDVAASGINGELFLAGKAPNGDLWWWRQTGNQWTWIGNNGAAAGALSVAPR